MMTFTEAVDLAATHCRAAIPSLNGQLDKALALLRTPRAITTSYRPDGERLTVRSCSTADVWYDVLGRICTCPDFVHHATQDNGYACKHLVATWLYRKAYRLMEQNVVSADTPPAPDSADTPALPGIPPQYLQRIHGRLFVRYAGLLALAHERGLVKLEARIEFHSETLVLASATATFSDGRTFTEWADATPANVTTQVRPHWIRMALTRAKARALRDALNIAVVALEELGEVDHGA